jgi:acetolactate synthase-1/2/3 large subunit
MELIGRAKKPVFYTGGGVINSGPEASQAAARAGAR